jgi:hypothetical protein
MVITVRTTPARILLFGVLQVDSAGWACVDA